MFVRTFGYFAIIAAVLSQQQQVMSAPTAASDEEVEKHALRQSTGRDLRFSTGGYWNAFTTTARNTFNTFGGGNGRNNNSGGNSGSTSSALDNDEKKTMLFMREEEKLARDVYLTLYKKYNVAVFSNIAKSEQAHMDRIRGLINTYNLDDPVADNTVGKFTNTELRGLYNDLVDKGKVSLLEALKVGALIEEIDIDDLDKAIEESDQSDIDQVYSNLRRASYGHLRAFVNNIEAMNVKYVAQHLSRGEVAAILNR